MSISIPECTWVSQVGREIFRIKSYEKRYRWYYSPLPLLGLVERLLLAQARQDHYELVAPVAHAKGRRAHTLPDRRGDLLQGSGPVEMPVRVPYGPVKKDHVHIIAPSRICIPQKTS